MFSFIHLLFVIVASLFNRIRRLNNLTWKISRRLARLDGLETYFLFETKLDEFNAFNRRDGHGRRISDSLNLHLANRLKVFKRLFVSF